MKHETAVYEKFYNMNEKFLTQLKSDKTQVQYKPSIFYFPQKYSKNLQTASEGLFLNKYSVKSKVK